jgi:equilibrative nucleoside transporter 1/2/3
MAITVDLEFMNGSFYFYLVMVFLVLTGVSTCLFQNAVFSEASQLPPIYLQAVLGYEIKKNTHF